MRTCDMSRSIQVPGFPPLLFPQELNVPDDYKTMTDHQQSVVLERHIVEMPNCPSHWTERHVTSFCSRWVASRRAGFSVLW